MKIEDKYTQYPGVEKTMDLVFNLLAKEKGRYNICPRLIYSNLTTRFIGKIIMYAPETSSTNDDAKYFAENSLLHPEGTVLIAEHQSKGKGRLGRKWVSLPGSVMLSVILRPKIPPMQVPALSLVTGYSIAKTIQDISGIDAKIKWPNDVLANDKKLCGILCEIGAEMDSISYVVIGMGINVNVGEADIPLDIKPSTSSIFVETGVPVNRNLFLARLFNEYEKSYMRFLQLGFSAFIPQIQGRLAYMGSQVTVSNATVKNQNAIIGTLIGIDEEGKLRIKQPGQPELSLAAGDVSLRPF